MTRATDPDGTVERVRAGRVVTVRASCADGADAALSLCPDCRHFRPGEAAHCRTAAAHFALADLTGTAAPVVACPLFDRRDPPSGARPTNVVRLPMPARAATA